MYNNIYLFYSEIIFKFYHIIVYFFYRELIQQALAYVRRSMKIFHANLSAWDIPYNESDIVNAKYKEKMLLLLLEGDESCNVNFEDLKI